MVKKNITLVPHFYLTSITGEIRDCISDRRCTRQAHGFLMGGSVLSRASDTRAVWQLMPRPRQRPTRSGLVEHTSPQGFANFDFSEEWRQLSRQLMSPGM